MLARVAGTVDLGIQLIAIKILSLNVYLFPEEITKAPTNLIS
jgi:hypothetical protein